MQHPAFLIAFFITIIRYYDYALFGLSASILAKNFLPPATHDVQMLGFFAILGGAVIARPIGSLIFGFIGDKYGRIKSIKISVIIATISTSLIAVTPSFIQIGNFAVIILIFCRMIFLMSLAGEVDAVKIYVAEKAGNNHKNLTNGIVVSCSQVGALLAAIAYYYANNFGSFEYLWRLNFLFGGMFGIAAILMRKFFKESEEFLYYRKKHPNKNDKNLWQILQDTRLEFIVSILINGSIGGIYHFLVIFLGIFLSQIAGTIDHNQAQTMNIILIIIYAIAAIFSGFLADKANPLKQIIASLALSLIIALVMQISLYKQIFIIYYPIILMGLAAFYAVPLQIIIQSLFIPTNKMRMYSLSHSLGGTLLSSATPFFSMLLWQNYKSLPITLSFFISLLIILITSVIVLLRSILVKKSYYK
ncbi:MFS transporter [Rickettsia endosymbiont of Halotydeus destructor]|uniref:MFS transporter n=1 Tax=Rickettsia endosymbiont of Halotydeus destructor TaxID=2996754 RepID=UPI003BB12FFD